MKYKIHYGVWDTQSNFYNLDTTINSSENYYKELKRLLKIKNVTYPKIRIGNPGDGGYIMIDNFNSKIAYSFGIDENISWDADMHQRGYDVFMYDPTVDFTCNSDKLHFYKIGIDGHNHDCFKTLKTLIEENNHNEEMILKMDVEGYEWNFLETVGDEINLFDQIALELHSLVSGDVERTLTLLDKLNKTHQLVHLHGNNSSIVLEGDNFIIPDVVEVLYVRKCYNFLDCNPELPIPIDCPNDLGRPDLKLGYWNS